MTSRIALFLGSTALAVSTLAAIPSAAAPSPSEPDASTAPAKIRAPHVTNGCLTSVPDPDGTEKVEICYTLFRPVGASRTNRVPVVIHSHGWGGSRTQDPARFSRFLEGGYGVLSFDQRGFGESGGHAYVENPAVEGHDVRKLVSLLAGKRWVKKDGPGDPRLGAIGGSYGGGYQFLGAFESLRKRGKPVFDALAPEITWHDLNQSLAPEGVTRTEWALVLAGASVPTDALPPQIYKALIEGAATGMWPDGSVPGGENVQKFFRKNGPRFHVANGRKLDIPVLFGQGTTDSLFPLEQGLTNWRKALTPKARKRSIFVGYNGGHVLPAVLPQGVNVTSDPCSKRLAGGDFEQLTVKFFDRTLRGKTTHVRGLGRIHLATPDSTCTTVRSVKANSTYDIGTVATTEAAGVPIAYEIAEGPIRIAGTPYLKGAVTAVGVENRAFYGLGIGTNPADARLVQNNVLPIREPLPVAGAKRRVDLPSVAVDVPAGKKLFLIASPFSETFLGMSSRTPGAITIDRTVVHLPVVRR